MSDIPPVVYWLACLLTLIIHLALASGMAFQTSDLLKRVPPEKRRISSRLSWLLLIPVFNCVWIWILLIQTSRSFQTPHSSIPFAVAVSASYSVLFVLLNPNWAWVAALLLFIPYRKRLLLSSQQKTAEATVE